MAGESDKERYLTDFRRFRASRSREPHEPQWIAPIREAAIERFAEIGFPSSREEEWRYTNVARLVAQPFRPSFDVEADAGAEYRGSSDVARLVFMNGRFVPGASRIESIPGLELKPLAAALASADATVERHLARHAAFDRNGFTALSTAFLEDGAYVAIADGAVIDEPIHLVFLTSAAQGEVIAHPRILVAAGRDSQATIVERYEPNGGGATLTNTVAEIALGEGARVRHVRVANEGAGASHVATTQVVQGRDSRYRSLAIVLEQAFLRHNLAVRCDAEGAECSLDGLYLAGGRGFVDNHTEIDHAAPHTASRELYKGVLAGHAKAVFNGKVIVRKDAQKTDAQQTNRNLLLSAHAEIDTKPELQISADDVKCSHGAAIGQLDRDALFYLESRGIGESKGRRILVRAFANEMVQRLAEPAVEPRLEEAIAARLDAMIAEER